MYACGYLYIHIHMLLPHVGLGAGPEGFRSWDWPGPCIGEAQMGMVQMGRQLFSKWRRGSSISGLAWDASVFPGCICCGGCTGAQAVETTISSNGYSDVNSFQHTNGCDDRFQVLSICVTMILKHLTQYSDSKNGCDNYFGE